MHPSPSVGAPGTSPKFDKFSFIRHMKNIGRAYRKQATELVSMCRTFVHAQEQTPDSDAKLRDALGLVDDALESATRAERKASEEVDKKFVKAINVLSNYEKESHFKETVTRRMAEARAKDKSSSTMLNVLKEKLRMKPPTPDECSEPTELVEFLLFRSLPDDKPTVVQQMLGKGSTLQEILWNFSRCKGKKRLTLKQNPHFYKSLPASREEYGNDFRRDPIETFQHATISVLTDNPGPTGRVFLETAQKTRAFGNVWVPKNAIIFKDVCGKLEGESIVGQDIRDTPNLWYFEIPLSSTSSPALCPDRDSSSPTMTATSTDSAMGVSIRDWKECSESIRQMVRSQDVNIRIMAKPLSNPGPSSSAPSSPISPVGSSNCDGSLPQVVLPRSQQPIRVQIPGRSAGLLTPSSYKTARSTPLSQQRPATELSPITPARPSPAPPLILPSPLAPTAAPPSPAALPLTVQATPALPTAHPLPDVPQRWEVTLLEEAPIPLQAPITGFPTTDVIVPITSSWQVISTARPHAEGKGGILEPVSTQVPVPENRGATSLSSDPVDLPPPVQAVQVSAVVPSPQTKPPKRNWFQKYIWDYKP